VTTRRVLRIFIPSTAVDLRDYRDKVRDAVLGLGYLPIAMETFSALSGQPASVCDGGRGGRGHLHRGSAPEKAVAANQPGARHRNPSQAVWAQSSPVASVRNSPNELIPASEHQSLQQKAVAANQPDRNLSQALCAHSPSAASVRNPPNEPIPKNEHPSPKAPAARPGNPRPAANAMIFIGCCVHGHRPVHPRDKMYFPVPITGPRANARMVRRRRPEVLSTVSRKACG
jgi:hypothetical protein